VIVAEGTSTAEEMTQYLSEHCQGREIRKSVLGHIHEEAVPLPAIASSRAVWGLLQSVPSCRPSA